jgi:hypothetical protein
MLVPGSVNPLLLTSAAGAAPAGYQIPRSIRINSADSANFSRTFSTSGTNLKIRTFSAWIKRTKLGSNSAIFQGYDGSSGASNALYFDTNNKLSLENGSGGQLLTTTQVFRDTSAWFHLLVAIDTTQSTDTNRVKIYVNGSQVTNFSSTSYIGQNVDTMWCLANGNNKIGAWWNNSSYSDLYLAEIHFIDGQALTPTSFGEFSATTGVWVPIEYTGSYGTNGFYLTFSDNSGTTSTTLGKDSAGSNNWTPNNFSVSSGAGNDSLVDVPTNGSEVDTGVGGEVRGNYCTWNAVDNGGVTLSNGNLDTVTSTSWKAVRGTIGISSGKWYWEYTMTAAGYTMLGMTGPAASLTTYAGVAATGYAYYSLNGDKWNNNTNTSYGNSFTTNDVIGVAFDADNGKIWFSKNGTWQASGNPAAGTNAAYSSIPSGTYFPTVSQDNSAGATGGATNFGARSFAYTAPSGFKALNTASLPAPVVTKPSTVMDVKLYTGNGSTQTITGFEFSPDLIWLKRRNQSADHNVLDTVRGLGDTGWSRVIYTSATNAEDSGTTNIISSFNSDGFTLGTEGTTNNNGGSFVAWCWDAGSSTVTNTQGSITGTVSVRANTTAGFSVVTYTGTGANATVGHGLGVAPRMVIIKRRDTTGNWAVYHAELANTQYMLLNSNAAVTTGTTYWNSTAPTSTVFSVGTSTDTNASSGTYVAYCFSAVSGYSAFGGYQAGTEPFVFLGFRPRYVMIKRTASGDGWAIFDTSRTIYNVATSRLEADTSAAEGGTDGVDLLSNGFKIKTTWGGMGGSSGSGLMIYAAFAESPFNYARAR